MTMATNQLKLYSLSEAAALMSIGRDTLRNLIADGKIGYILVGSSKKIPKRISEEIDQVGKNNQIVIDIPLFLFTLNNIIQFSKDLFESAIENSLFYARWEIVPLQTTLLSKIT